MSEAKYLGCFFAVCWLGATRSGGFQQKQERTGVARAVPGYVQLDRRVGLCAKGERTVGYQTAWYW